MSTPSAQPMSEEIRRAAAQWMIRRDRGLSSAESIEYELWLAADSRHAAAMKRGGLPHVPQRGGGTTDLLGTPH